MKILLINPPVDGIEETVVIPMGLAYIASVLMNHHEIKVVDLRAYPKYDIADEILEADAVGITATILSARSCKKLLRFFKEKKPGIVTIIGGSYPTAIPERVLSNKDVDIIVLGEGENTAVELFDVLEKGDDLSKVNGIGYRENGNTCFTPPRELISDIDSLPYPAHELFPLELYTGFNPAFKGFGRTGSILTSRGCPYNCIYCFKKTFGNKWRCRSPESIVKEWAYQIEKLNVKQMAIIDDCFNLDIERAVTIFSEVVANKVNIPWLAPVGMRADRFTQELLDKMKQSGCFRISIGVENGNQEYLNKVVKKHFDFSKAKETVSYCRKIGIETAAFYILGLPQENKKTMQQTINFAKELDTDYAQFLIANPFPGTEFFDIVQREGKILRDVEDYSGHADNRANFEMGELDEELLVKMRKKAYWSFYMRPKMITKKMLSDPTNLIRGGYYLLKRMVTGA